MLRGLWVILVFLTSTAAMAVVAIAGEVLFPRRDVTNRLGRVWSRILLAAAGVRPAHAGLENIPARACVFVSNHQSIVDIWALFPVLPSRTRFVAKASLFRIPLFGWALRVGGFVALDRERRDRAYASIGRAGDLLRRGHSVIIFPEGTRSRDGRLLPFKRGAFRLALDAGVPVVPIALSGSGCVLRPGTISIAPGSVRVAVAPPIEVESLGAGDLSALRDEAWAAVAARLSHDELPEPGSSASADE